jgi:hypothetical protein
LIESSTVSAPTSANLLGLHETEGDFGLSAPH